MLTPSALAPDVAIIGAGPAGCVTALALAGEGARVLLLDSQPRVDRLAGEWLHPPGVRILQQLGLDPFAGTDHPPGRGFVVFPEDGSSPIQLPYSGNARALTRPHDRLIADLRQACADQPRIHLLVPAQVTRLDSQRLTFAAAGQAGDTTCHVGLIVGADGRSSLVRRRLGRGHERTLLSHMAGVLVEDAELPFEGFGHVFLGGPGPMLVLRIGARQVRVCLDVPVGLEKAVRPPALWDGYLAVLPEGLRRPLRRALLEQRVAWAANQWRPRTDFGRERMCLVGDAVGHFHPLTAAGMTLGFQDGLCLAKSRHFADYRRRRLEECGVPEMLAMGLYRLFTLRPDSRSLRQAVYRLWRESPADCRQTIRMLAGDETRQARFNQSFLRVFWLASQSMLHEQLFAGRLRQTVENLVGFGEWLAWFASHSAPRLLGTPGFEAPTKVVHRRGGCRQQRGGIRDDGAHPGRKSMTRL